MKIKLSLFVFAFIFWLKSFAQPATANPILSIGLETAKPIGDFGRGSKVGFGLSAKIAKPVITNGTFTFSTGYINFSGKILAGAKVPTVNLIPIKAGFRYRSEPGFYVEPQVGVTTVIIKGFQNEGDFTYAGNIGFLINRLDLSIRYESLINEVQANSYFGLRAAFNFPL